LAPIVQFLQQHWPRVQSSSNPKLAPILNKKDKLPLCEGCILWGTTVVVPSPYRDAVLTELHDGHPGIRASMCGGQQ